jgi:alpha-beta hydrolase superfamily lysophospholipase
MKRMRRIAWWSAGCAVLWLALCACIGIIAMEGALHPSRRPVTPEDLAVARAVSERDGATLTGVSIAADDGTALRAWSFARRKGNGDAVILLHGQGDNRAGMLGTADMLLRHGYSVLAPDARAQGESDGTIATYGVKEADDVRRWYAWLERSLSPSPHCVYGLGESMGAAIVLEAVATEPGLCAVVAESTFSSFREAAYVRLGQAFHTGSWLGRTLLRPAVEAGMMDARWRYGVDLERASPAKAVAASHVPILLIHGLADANLPARFSEQMKAENAAIALWEPLNAGHCGAASAEPAEYQRRVLNWLAGHSAADGVLQGPKSVARR